MPIKPADAEHLSARTTADLYNTLEQCTKWFAGQPFTIEDAGIHPYKPLERADKELAKSKGKGKGDGMGSG